MLRRFQTGYEDGNYSLIAGHLDGQEDVVSAMRREAREEAGIDLDIGSLEIVQVMHRRKATEERIDYFFSCRRWQGEISNMEPHKCDDLSWFMQDRLPHNTVDYIAAAWAFYRAGQRFTLYGWTD